MSENTREPSAAAEQSKAISAVLTAFLEGTEPAIACAALVSVLTRILLKAGGDPIRCLAATMTQFENFAGIHPGDGTKVSMDAAMARVQRYEAFLRSQLH